MWFHFCLVCLLFVMTAYAASAAPSSSQPRQNAQGEWVAPFSDSFLQEEIQQKPNNLGDLYLPYGSDVTKTGIDNSLPANKPHRSEKQLEEWLYENIADVLTYDLSTFADAYRANIVLFTADGLAQYRDYLQSSGLLYTMQQEKTRLSTIVTDVPRLLNQGALGGQYKWLFDVPVMLSFLPENADSIHRVKVANKNQIIRLQLARNPESVGLTQDNVRENDVLIETWAVLPAAE